jgi:hypothetical protein
VPLPVAGGLDRVDRPHLIARRDQGLHPRAAVGLDPDQHLVRLVVITQMVRDQRMQGRDARDPFR